jgi:hypothetical protein
MKRAKIMLLAIAVVATVGGALAFKATTFQPGNVYCKIAAAGTTCALTSYTTNFIAGQATTTQPCVFGGSYYTTITLANAACKGISTNLTVTSVPE